jgi:uncharacterized protein YyaL (SSP411 family)
MPNRLADESSPYLRQHADNPVDWVPYSEEVFRTARAEDKPILLSIGYSACHWCHVMAHESFEDVETARLMNERYVCVKVDREEMPDVDQIYQHALQLMGESGGWPLTMFLQPSGVPYFGGTYFPKRDGLGRPSFKRLLLALSDAYRTDRAAVDDNAAKFKGGLERMRQLAAGRAPSPILPDVVERAASRLEGRIDRREGGFEGAPKFPNPKAMELLLRASRRCRRTGDADAAELLACVEITLVKMAEGGIYDQLGGGFHRYSTDALWLVPHFEKMLYDNAQLLRLYAETWQVTRNPLFPRVIDETAAYLEREMRSLLGGLYTAQDADSEGVEGKYFVFQPAELAALLTKDEAVVAARCLGVVEGGNFHDPHGHSEKGASILHVVDRPRDEREAALLATARKKLLDARQRRVPPLTDDKILASTNGLAIAGLAEAGRILDRPHLVDAARRTAEFVLAHMRSPADDGRLLRTATVGQDGRVAIAKLPGTLDDHAFVADGLIALYEATGEGRWLDEAARLTRLAVDRFYEPAEQTFYLTAAADPGLIERPISTYDGAIPSGMSVCLQNLLRLGDVLGEGGWIDLARSVLERHAARALENPFGHANLLNALDLFLEGTAEIVLADAAGDARDGLTALERAVAAVYLPNRVLVRAEGAPLALEPLTRGKRPLDGRAAAYVCRGFTCQRPESDADALKRSLS